MVARKGDRLSDEQRRVAIDELIYFFEKERGEEIGKIAAEQLLNFFLESVGHELFNQGVITAKNTIEARMEDVKYDLDDLLDM